MTERPGFRKLGAWGVTKSTCTAEPSASRARASVYEGDREDGLSFLGLFSRAIWLLSLTCLEGWCCLACTKLQAFVATSYTHCSMLPMGVEVVFMSFISYLSDTVLWQIQLTEGFIGPTVPRVQSVMMGKSWQQGLGHTVGHTAPAAGTKRGRWTLVPSSLLSMLSGATQPMEWCCPHSG